MTCRRIYVLHNNYIDINVIFRPRIVINKKVLYLKRPPAEQDPGTYHILRIWSRKKGKNWFFLLMHKTNLFRKSFKYLNK